MVTYLLYKSRNNVTPYVELQENTIDTTSTSVYLIGKRTEAFGDEQNQSALWMLENFANSTIPDNSILGQNWFNTVDNKLYVCINETGPVYEKVGRPIVSGTTPTLSLLTGDLWYNTGDGRLYAYNGVTWTIIGPISTIPTTAQIIQYLTTVTTDGTATEMFVNGVTDSRMVVATNQSMQFIIDLVARNTIDASEVISMSFAGVVDRPNVGAVNIPGGVLTNIYNITSSYAGSVGATVGVDVANNALVITVTGQTAKVVQWTAICKLTIVTN